MKTNAWAVWRPPEAWGPWARAQRAHWIRRPCNQSINQSINLYRAIVQRRVLQCGYAESKRNVLRRIFSGWSSSTVQWKRVPTIEDYKHRMAHINTTV